MQTLIFFYLFIPFIKPLFSSPITTKHFDDYNDVELELSKEEIKMPQVHDYFPTMYRSLITGKGDKKSFVMLKSTRNKEHITEGYTSSSLKNDKTVWDLSYATNNQRENDFSKTTISEKSIENDPIRNFRHHIQEAISNKSSKFKFVNESAEDKSGEKPIFSNITSNDRIPAKENQAVDSSEKDTSDNINKDLVLKGEVSNKTGISTDKVDSRRRDIPDDINKDLVTKPEASNRAGVSTDKVDSSKKDIPDNINKDLVPKPEASNRAGVSTDKVDSSKKDIPDDINKDLVSKSEVSNKTGVSTDKVHSRRRDIPDDINKDLVPKPEVSNKTGVSTDKVDSTQKDISDNINKVLVLRAEASNKTGVSTDKVDSQPDQESKNIFRKFVQNESSSVSGNLGSELLEDLYLKELGAKNSISNVENSKDGQKIKTTDNTGLTTSKAEFSNPKENSHVANTYNSMEENSKQYQRNFDRKTESTTSIGLISEYEPQRVRSEKFKTERQEENQESSDGKILPSTSGIDFGIRHGAENSSAREASVKMKRQNGAVVIEKSFINYSTSTAKLNDPNAKSWETGQRQLEKKKGNVFSSTESAHQHTWKKSPITPVAEKEVVL